MYLGANTGGSAGLWSWSAPKGVSLRGIRLRRRVTIGTSVGDGTSGYRLFVPDGFVREDCNSRIGCFGLASSIVAVSGLNGGSVSSQVYCEAAHCQDAAGTGATWAAIQAAELSLGDDAPPIVSEIRGSMTSQEPAWGRQEVLYRATDIGGGVYRHRVEIDGRTVLEEVPDLNGGRCRDAMPGWGSAYEFDYRKPCPSSVAGRIALDFRRVAAGRHDLKVSVEDAAGNRRTILQRPVDVVSDPTQRVFDYEGVIDLRNPLGERPGLVPNGQGANRAATLSVHVLNSRGRQASTAVATYPRTPTVVGRLTIGEQPIVGAVLGVLVQESGSPTWRASGVVTTSPTGAAWCGLPSGPSRLVRLAYFADSEATSFISSPIVQLRVRPRVALRAAPRSLRTGRRVRFVGRVDTDRRPNGGLVVTLQAGTAGSQWITFRTVRTKPDGRFRASYRFSNTKGSVRYRFRAVVSTQSNLPFVSGRSGSAWIRVRG
jgi:hypothetical protein